MRSDGGNDVTAHAQAGVTFSRPTASLTFTGAFSVTIMLPSQGNSLYLPFSIWTMTRERSSTPCRSAGV
ncbi:hypothetical protein ACVWZR_010129 [Bradyrhizobium sp. i1.3.1]